MSNKPNIHQSFKFAFEGIRFTFKYNRNIRIHIVIAILVIIASVLLQINAFEAGMICIMILLVICTEMINTVVEEVVNMITKEYRLEAKVAKDVAAAMVLVTAIGAVIVGLFVFIPHILRLLK